MAKRDDNWRKRACFRCKGDGLDPHISGVACKRCGGSGWDPR